MSKSIAIAASLLCFLCILKASQARIESNDHHHTSANATTEQLRKGKLFSLFSVVNFNNDPCQSTAAASGTANVNRNGTCLTSTECSSRGGGKNGNCAAGFGVCCVYIINSEGGATVTQNSTYIQNNGFPNALANPAAIAYKINKAQRDVCFFRLDFDTFNIAGPIGTDEDVANAACADSLTITGQANTQYPMICGLNSGEHVFIDVGPDAGDSATLTFAFRDETMAQRSWDIRVDQILCSDPNTPDTGCFQYVSGVSATFKTFNFQGTTHLNNQEYTWCLRQEKGYCCAQYQVCPGIENSFTLDSTQGVNNVGKVDADCVKDFIAIDALSLDCRPNVGPLPNFVNKNCGNKFVFTAGAAKNQILCDCNAPFRISVVTNQDLDADDVNAMAINKGNCLSVTQIPC